MVDPGALVGTMLWVATHPCSCETLGSQTWPVADNEPETLALGVCSYPVERNLEPLENLHSQSETASSIGVLDLQTVEVPLDGTVALVSPAFPAFVPYLQILPPSPSSSLPPHTRSPTDATDSAPHVFPPLPGVSQCPSYASPPSPSALSPLSSSNLPFVLLPSH